ncbi:probable tRNA (guanine(26)-N(2))-dimethyltransferase [Anoplophora glabripennis]|uniref:probable tRNA (guanine(26)-N(2))-dimethyltransferase n=1 Tax=Anoplophora glabripennis TaxID=217634 RepID=UPI0008755E0B|nr:probable tRNA (guanine(26)-N(2))-dimethyltransferase [Anoplophora glabripennis]
METDNQNETQIITEGLAKIRTAGNVFYNPVQEFNRDLSISVITTFAKLYTEEKIKKADKQPNDINVITSYKNDTATAGVKCEDGISILEALSATGLRSIRYAKEIPGIKEIIANDISHKAVEDIKRNIAENNVADIVSPSHSDATLLMYQHRKGNQFDVIDLDPYGCPSVFLDSAVQAVKEGGLLLITATDMAVLAGNSPETCYSKYGAVSLRIKSCHEMALRILLQCIEAHANRYGRYIIPLISLSADFYVRVFVRVFSGAYKCKFTTSKLSHVYHCTGCDSFALQPLGILRTNDKNNKQVKFSLPTGPSVPQKCEHCGHPHHIGGPIWSAPLHSPEFVQAVLRAAPENLNTYKRIQGVLSVIGEELLDVPLYYTLERLSGVIHVEMPPILALRSAILNAGYKVSFTHMNKTSVKTNAPAKVIWDIMRCWEKKHPISKKRHIENTPVFNILAQQPEKDYSFEIHPNANPESRKMGFLRFQENPSPHWGPGSRATAMVGDQKILKSKKNQGKRKRELSQESIESKKE